MYLLYTCVFLVHVFSIPEPNDIYLVRAGKPLVYVVEDNQIDSRSRQVIEDFRGIIYRATSVELPAQPEPGLIPLYIGEPNDFGSLFESIPPLDPEEFELRISSEAICILGGSSLGTSHGVYTLLRDMGFRWIMPGEIGECLPHEKDLHVPQGSKREKPAFSYRDIWYAYGSSPEGAQRLKDWLRRNRMYRPLISHGHNLTTTLERVAPFEQRPDLYALINGKRQKTQICTSQTEVVELIAQSIKEYMKTHPDLLAYSLCPDDNADFCECDACRALDSGIRDAGGKPSVSDRLQVFFNQVLERLQSDYPNLLLTTYSYNVNHTTPPVNTPVHPNTCVFVTSSMYCSAHGVGDTECPSRQEFKNLLISWCKLTPHVYIYEYDPVPYSGGLPWPLWRAHAREMKLYKEIGIKGVSFEGQNSWAAYFPNYYIAAQFMWDPFQNPQEVFEDMLQSFFEDAAPEMKIYYETLGSVFCKVSNKVGWGLGEYPHYFKNEIVEKCARALERAEQKPVSPLVQRRLEMVRLSFEEMNAYLRLRRPPPDISYEEYKQTIQKLDDSINQMAAINEDYILAQIAREKTRAGIADRFAREQGFINEWLLCGPFDNEGMQGHESVYPPEEKVDIQASYIGKGGKSVSWRPNQTPQWAAYIDLTNEFEEKDWTVAYAVCWVMLEEGPRKVAFRVGSNDSVKIFLNGKPIWDNKVLRTAMPDQDTILVTLPTGSSSILLKIGQTGANWGFYFRITEPDSLEIPPGLHVFREPPRKTSTP